MVLTCHCWFVVASVWSGQRVQIVCLENGSGCYDVCHGIDWNGRMPENGYLKCLNEQETLFNNCGLLHGPTPYATQSLAIKLNLTPLSPSLSEALAEAMLSSRSGMLSRVALSSLWTTIFSLPFDLSISFLASIKERFSVTVPLIWGNQKKSLLVMTGEGMFSHSQFETISLCLTLI